MRLLVRSPHARPSRDAVAITFLFGLLTLMAWQADRARGMNAAPSQPATLGDCASIVDEDDRLTCLEAVIDVRLVSADPLDTVLTSINQHARRDAPFSRRCHMLMHEHGRRHGGVVLPGTITHDGKDCAAGFLHGWMMEHLGDLDRTTVDAWCEPTRTTLEHADCEHGMGHVLVRHLDGDLRAALRRCRALGDRAFLRNCASGAFMENRFGGQATDGAADTPYWREGDPWLPCRAAAPRDLVDACAAWAVRDLPSGDRREWCERLGGRTNVDVRPCLIAAGSTAPIERDGDAACGASTTCWFGRGFAWAIIGWDHEGADEAAASCTETTGPRLAACARGVGFRRAASIADPIDIAAAVSCDHLFVGSARSACHDGASQRGAPIAYA